MRGIRLACFAALLAASCLLLTSPADAGGIRIGIGIGIPIGVPAYNPYPLLSLRILLTAIRITARTGTIITHDITTDTRIRRTRLRPIRPGVRPCACVSSAATGISSAVAGISPAGPGIGASPEGNPRRPRQPMPHPRPRRPNRVTIRRGATRARRQTFLRRRSPEPNGSPSAAAGPALTPPNRTNPGEMIPPPPPVPVPVQ